MRPKERSCNHFRCSKWWWWSKSIFISCYEWWKTFLGKPSFSLTTFCCLSDKGWLALMAVDEMDKNEDIGWNRRNVTRPPHSPKVVQITSSQPYNSHNPTNKYFLAFCCNWFSLTQVHVESNFYGEIFWRRMSKVGTLVFSAGNVFIAFALIVLVYMTRCNLPKVQNDLLDVLMLV